MKSLTKEQANMKGRNVSVFLPADIYHTLQKYSFANQIGVEQAIVQIVNAWVLKRLDERKTETES